MGNSGSMHGLASYEEGHHHHHHAQSGYHHHHQRYHDAMRGEGQGSSSWMDSYQRGGGDHGRRGPRDYDFGHHHLHHHLAEQLKAEGEHPQQIKVLPDIPGKVAKLRSTNNGNILHAGGTISKNNQALQRSKSISSPTYQQHQSQQQQQQQQQASFSECDEELAEQPPPPRLLMTRSRTQLQMLGPARAAPAEHHHRSGGAGRGGGGPVSSGPRQPLPRNATDTAATVATAAALNHRKHFGSEPDLRVSNGGAPRNGTGGSEQQQGGGAAAGAAGAGAPGPRKPNTAQSKIMKGKNKKKAAPVPPASEKRDAAAKELEPRQRIIAYSPMRKPNGDGTAASGTLPPSGESGYNVTATRKLRLFKTRAETKKTPPIAKLPEASDAKFGRELKHGGGFRSAAPPSSSASAPSGQLILAGGHHQQHQTNADKQPPAAALERVSARPNPVSFFRREKTFDAGLLGLERKQPAAAKPTMSPPLSRRKSIVKSLLLEEEKEEKPEEPKARGKGHSGAITDFQKELQLATRRQQSPEPGRTRRPAAAALGSSSKVAPANPVRVHVPSKPTTKPSPPAPLVIPLAEPKPAADHSPTKAPIDSSPPATPPPPPPPPKTSFYFGMCGGSGGPTGGRQEEQRDRLAEYLAERRRRDEQQQKQQQQQQQEEEEEEHGRAEQERMDGGRAGSEGRSSCATPPDEGAIIGHTQMELIDQFAASLLNGSRFRSSDSLASSEADVRVSTAGSSSWAGEEIALKLRPTLPRKQFDIPRFSPAAAWRLLTTEDDFGREAGDGGGAGQDELAGGEKKVSPFLRGYERDMLEVPEDRIQRVYREPVPVLQDNKSGDSGISGDAGLPELADGKEQRPGDCNGTEPKLRKQQQQRSQESQQQQQQQHQQDHHRTDGGWSSSNALLLMPWTPQQDLEDDEDESSAGGNGSDTAPHARGQLIEDEDDLIDGGRGGFSAKGHLFSLSLPRENHLSIYNVEVSDEKVEKHMFNSLQKFRKSVTGAFKSEESGTIGISSDNWFLGRLDTAGTSAGSGRSSSGGGGGGGGGGIGVGAVGSGQPEKRPKLLSQPTSYTSLERAAGREKDSAVHSSIGYLVSGKHMMYLPREPTKMAVAPGKQDQNNNSRSYRNQNGGSGEQQVATVATNSPASESARSRQAKAEDNGLAQEPTTANGVRPAREDKENLQDPMPANGAVSGAGGSSGAASGDTSLEHFPVKLSNRRNHRFTFQSTIRQIEKRRVAEKLSREAEIKEAMRLSELEAMRRVEEEFQRKRAREKASIRHQLRLFSMENHHPDQQQQQQHHHHQNGHDDGDNDLTGDGKRSDPDGDSLPHQNTAGGGAGGIGGGRGLYRRKEFTSMERQRSYRLEDGVPGRYGGRTAGSTFGATFHATVRRCGVNSDDEDDDNDNDNDNDDNVEDVDEAEDDGEELLGCVDGTGGRRRASIADDDCDTSSLGYVDTRTPYISRIIQAKSSKSAYGGALRK